MQDLKEKAEIALLVVVLICAYIFVPFNDRPIRILFLLGIIVIPVLYFFILKSQQKIQKALSGLGLVHLSEKEFQSYLDKSKYSCLNPKIASIGLTNYYTGIISGYQICIFNMTPPGDHIERNTAVHFRLDAIKLPKFIIRPGQFADKITEMFVHGLNKLEFPHQSRFSDQYIVKGEDEKAIRDMLNPSIINVISQIDRLHIESLGNELIVYQDYSAARKPKQYQDHITRSINIVKALTAAEIDLSLSSQFR